VVTSPEDPNVTPVSYPQTGFPDIPGSADILLIRHGQSEPYVPGTPFPLAGGHADPGLTPRGHEQAARLAGRLSGTRIDAIYMTPLRRTAQTAAPLADRLGLTPRVEPGLREVHLGEWEGGQYRQRVAEHDPIVMQVFQAERWEVIPGAETSASFSARVREAIDRLAAAHPGQRLAVFTHGGVIGQALAQASGSRPFAFLAADNGSISRLLITGQRWIVRGFNDTAHLASPDPAATPPHDGQRRPAGGGTAG
jgi:2,3-bisphosphoglycerate-dependent phosphoglycerate mutase